MSNVKIIYLDVGASAAKYLAANNSFFNLIWKLGYYTGWEVIDILVEDNTLRIGVQERGTPLLLIFVGAIVALLAMFGIFYSIHWIVKDYFNNQIENKGIKTQEDAASDLKEIINNTEIPADVKEIAAKALIEIEKQRGTTPLPTSPNTDSGGNSFIGGLSIGSIAGIVLVIALLNATKK